MRKQDIYVKAAEIDAKIMEDALASRREAINCLELDLTIDEKEALKTDFIAARDAILDAIYEKRFTDLSFPFPAATKVIAITFPLAIDVYVDAETANLLTDLQAGLDKLEA
ncbi:MAG: hypothetical protein ACOX3W_08110 [Christensenellaceae bacterium]|jgi:hypothetical protein